ncbi:sporulation protein SsgA [Streptomyces sp. NBC_00190]|uniref:plasmid transfer protein TraA n=1 Tax=Streptomyces sp. NBC_00190 TaxID=2903634 RepID=UPI002E2DE5DC|nr:plasmid transfer protein TraA [Streptomyces sp. NBC_00190]
MANTANNAAGVPRQPRGNSGQQNNAGTGGGRSRTTNRTRNYNFNIGGQGGSGGGQAQGRGGPQGGQRGFAGRGQGARHGAYSPLADPEFFSNVDIRNYCDNGRAVFLQMSFELANAAEMLNAVLKEIPDPEGRPFGSRARARRVSKRLKKAAEDALGSAKNMAATYAAFQREFDPELAPYQARRPRQGGRRFDFNS